ncbi:U-box domain-containing protein 4 [Selaginella moellendorffii]|uniref:U-box domain-containing protein 4 n=1 Tax=Selaginella moellendorffii TaxID=88036 RepID=UPI000D1C5FEF|nr:U-box domain-containing protein 4 [Selaginella moellendorffii]|eukprot:XP_024541602.1 U-box domain-containing protein 4 [Selaginella moellendorffii]
MLKAIYISQLGTIVRRADKVWDGRFEDTWGDLEGQGIVGLVEIERGPPTRPPRKACKVFSGVAPNARVRYSPIAAYSLALADSIPKGLWPDLTNDSWAVKEDSDVLGLTFMLWLKTHLDGEELDWTICQPEVLPTSRAELELMAGDPKAFIFSLKKNMYVDAIIRLSVCWSSLLAKDDMQSRILVVEAGAVRPLIALLDDGDEQTQEIAVTALLNLSINDNNKAEISRAGAIDPLVRVLKAGSSAAVENAAATLFNLSVVDNNKEVIGAAGAISPLVELLASGSPGGKKDAATALFNLSTSHDNKPRMVRAGAIRPLVELASQAATGMVDKAVAILANLSTVPEGRVSIAEEGGIIALVQVVETGSPRGQENAAAALLHLCINSSKHRAMVLQEGAVPPLHALSLAGTPRGKDKRSA